ncbi:transcription factor IIIA-like isoform X1 [Malus sylvestris]|uniref:transcription factor IIIA-like isoform X1 n=1 Tax=Malus sylvestris TaxID=3752 RepID=UPI0010AB0929|nr:transcription factor IIIA-like isoform X1 [Malus domestica]XP_050124263.1 transcription factor IIIA-like isoform X1 [Malus sylvestris]
MNLAGESERVERELEKSMDNREADQKVPVFKDIRRYYCEFCGICRFKETLIASHILNHHKQMDMAKEAGGEGEGEKEKCNTCEECGATFKKPAHLKQHIQSHSLERPYVCSVDDCRSSFRRKDHLNRHLLQHQGKLFKCPIENCNRGFVCQGNMSRHVKELHSEDGTYVGRGQKQHVCQEIGCGKVFLFASKLRKHESSHVHMDSVEAFCSEAGCMKYFTNDQCLKDHILSCHQHVTCEICGSKKLKRNIKRHLLTHKGGAPSVERIKCSYKGCLHTFSTKSNLTQHVKAVHLEDKPFACSFSGCGMRFAYKHVRDNHEKTGRHVYAYGDFVEADEQFQSRPRGGRKRKCPTIEMLLRKRVTPPAQLGLEPEYLSWLLSQDAEDEN